MPTRSCPVCHTTVMPFSHDTLTAHEFRCFKARPELVPEAQRARFENTLVRERRSAAAFRGVETRRANGGKRAPRG